MLDVLVLDNKTSKEYLLKLPMEETSLQEVINSINNLYIKKVNNRLNMYLQPTENLVKLNNYLSIFKQMKEEYKNKIKALTILYKDFCLAMEKEVHYDFFNAVTTMSQYGEYIAKHEVKLPKRFLIYMDFENYAKELQSLNHEIHFTKYGLLRKRVG